MTRWLAGVGTVVLAVAAFAGPAAAKPADPCKILKPTEIQDQLGADVSAPDRGLKTATTVECTWDVAASAARPAGSVTARIMFVGGKAAYTGLKTNPDFATVAEPKHALYQASTGTLSVLAGKNLVTVQAVFLTPPPVSVVDVQAQLVPLVKLASKRA